MSIPETGAGRNKDAIVQEMFDLTCSMISHLEEYEFLVDAIDKRQLLADEYTLQKESPRFLEGMDEVRQVEVANMIKNMSDMDKTIMEALKRMLAEAKKELASSNNQQKLLGYMNQSASMPGSQMDHQRV